MAWTRDTDQSAKAIRRPNTNTFTAWGDFARATMQARFPGTTFAETTRREVKNLTGPQTNRQTAAWRAQGAALVGYTKATT